MNLVCGIIYAAIIIAFCIGTKLHHSLHIGAWLYVMLALFCVSVAYCIYMIVREMIKRKNMLETMAATDMLPYVRYSRASIVILWLATIAMPFAILSTSLLFIVGPMALLALLFFNLTFIALGSNYVPTEELLDKEEENNAAMKTNKVNHREAWTHLGKQQETAEKGTESIQQQLSEERKNFIQKSLDKWCADLGYKDSAVNMLTLSRSLCISKDELTMFFSQCLKSTFRIWLSDIRFDAAKIEYLIRVMTFDFFATSEPYLYRSSKSSSDATDRMERLATDTKEPQIRNHCRIHRKATPFWIGSRHMNRASGHLFFNQNTIFAPYHFLTCHK